MSFSHRRYNGAVVVGIVCDTDLGIGHESILDGFAVACDRLVVGRPESV